MSTTENPRPFLPERPKRPAKAELIDRYLEAWSLERSPVLSIAIDDVLYPLPRPIVPVHSFIGVLLDCPYSTGLSIVEGYTPLPNPRPTFEEIRSDINLFLGTPRRQEWDNFYFYLKRQGVTFSYKPTIVETRRSSIISFETWKFSREGKIRNYDILQSRIAAYMLYSWTECLDFTFTIKAWTGDCIRTFRDYNYLLPEIKPPTEVKTLRPIEKVFTTAEKALNKMARMFLGKVELKPKPGKLCIPCPKKSICKYFSPEN